MPLASLLAALVGAIVGAIAAGEQWRLYREPEFRDGRASGRKLQAMRALVAGGCAVTLGIAWRPDHYDAGPAAITSVFLIILVVLASTDFERKRLPNKLTYPSVVVAAAVCWAWPDRSIADVAIGGGAALLIGGGVLVLGGLVGGAAGARGVIPFGVGDVKLMVLMGLLCGWPAVTSALIIGALLAGVPSVAMIIRGKRRTAIAYGPYLAIGCMIVLLFPGRFV